MVIDSPLASPGPHAHRRPHWRCSRAYNTLVVLVKPTTAQPGTAGPELSAPTADSPMAPLAGQSAASRFGIWTHFLAPASDGSRAHYQAFRLSLTNPTMRRAATSLLRASVAAPARAAAPSLLRRNLHASATTGFMVRSFEDVQKAGDVVKGKRGSWESRRYYKRKDGLGFSFHHTILFKGACVSGSPPVQRALTAFRPVAVAHQASPP